MKKRYARPELIEFGAMKALTLGTTGGLDEINQHEEDVGQCTGESPNQVDCHVITS